MGSPIPSDTEKSRLTPFLFLLLLVLLAYSNTFHASWHMDDYPNILGRAGTHARDLNRYLSLDLSHGGFDGQFSRPVSRFTFALNWYFSKAEVKGYHIVNVSLHFLTAWILYLTALRLGETPNLKSKFKGEWRTVALLTSAFWAVHPIQTQAVTYIVQRMSILAALFYVLAMFLYLCGRMSSARRTRAACYGGCLLGYALAMGSKENAVILPLALFLAEITFLQDLEAPRRKRTVTLLVAGIALGLIAVTFFVFVREDPSSFLGHFRNRAFTPLERLLTQPRVLILYLSQIIYPHPSRLSIVHDIQVSRSLLNPWTTGPAILIVAGLIAYGVSQIRNRPLISFALLFFFLNHLIESSFIPLELVFEHRNYLPTAFLFLTLSPFLARILSRPGSTRRFLSYGAAPFVALILIALGLCTYQRNKAWLSERNLWEDALAKAPGSALPYHNLASTYYHKSGLYDQALKYYQASLTKANPNNVSFASAPLTNMAYIYYETGNYEKAVEASRRAIRINPGKKAGYIPLLMSLAKLGRQEELKRYSEIFARLCRPRHPAPGSGKPSGARE